MIVGSKIHEGTGKIDRRKLYKDALGMDMQDGPGVDMVADLEDWDDVTGSLCDADGVFDAFNHIECTSVLEHSRRPWRLCSNLEHLMGERATILVMVPWVWRTHGYPDDYWRMTPSAVASLLPSITWEKQSYIVEDKLVDEVPKLHYNGIRWHARSELVMFGRKCALKS